MKDCHTLSTSSSTDFVQPLTKTRRDRTINVLVINDEQAAVCLPCPNSAADVSIPAGILDRPTLAFVHVQGREDTAERLRNARFDAILDNRRDIGALAGLCASVTDLPILAVPMTDDVEIARQAIDAGAEDVLLSADFDSLQALSCRIGLAIARKAAEPMKLRRSREDGSTGLANGILLEERFNRSLARADRYATLVGLVAVDIDDFPALMQRHGAPITDQLIPAVGQRLLGETRQTDTLARTRPHGFTWLVEGLSAISDISALVNRLPRQLALPFAVDGQSIQVTVSVGVAIAPLHGRDFPAVHGMAEAAMFDVASISGDALLMLPIPAAPEPARSAVLT